LSSRTLDRTPPGCEPNEQARGRFAIPATISSRTSLWIASEENRAHGSQDLIDAIHRTNATAGSHLMYEKFENVVAIKNEKCSQLFFLYSGLQRTIGGMRALGFLKKSQLENRNIIMLIDPHKAGYRKGISTELQNLDDLLQWQREYLERLPHVQTIYSIGVSAGSFAAIHTGYHLKVDTVWTFGARSPAPQYWGQDPEVLLRDQAMRPFDPDGDLLQHCMLDEEIIMQTRELLLQPNGVTKYRLYYAPSNYCDSLAHTLISDLPDTSSHPIVAPDDYPYATGPNWDHKILPIIQHMGGLPDLFPPFASA
jgi:hypothetical protein